MRRTYLCVLPSLLVLISGPANAVPVEVAIEDGVNWLIENQNPDGSWGSEVDLLSTAFSINALEELGYNVTEDKMVLLADNYTELKDVSLVYLATDDGDLKNLLLSSQDTDGSWVDVSTTSVVLIVLSKSGYSGVEVDNAIQFLEESQNRDGSWGSWGEGGYTKETALAAYALMKSGVEDNSTKKAINWLVSHQRVDGSWTYIPDTAFALLALNLSGNFTNETKMAADFLNNVQNLDGGWGTSEGQDSRIYPSAISVLALAGYEPALGSVSGGVDYLLSARNPSGGWSTDESRGSITDTGIVIETLEYLNYTGPALTKAKTWLLAQNATTVDQLSWKIIGLSRYENVSEDIGVLLKYQNQDGGWGVNPGYESDLVDTSFAVEALTISDQRWRRAEIGTEFILKYASMEEDVSTRSVSIIALRDYSLIHKITSLEIFRCTGEWLVGAQRGDGGWGNIRSTPLDTSLALSALLVSIPASDATQNASDYLLSTQLPDGSWGDLMSTIHALKALHAYTLTGTARILNVSIYEVKNGTEIPSVQFPAYSTVKLLINYTGNDVKLEGYVGNRSIVFNDSLAAWNTANLPPGDYLIEVRLVDRRTGVILDSWTEDIHILPTWDVKGGGVLITPSYTDINTETDVTLSLSLQLKANIGSDINVSYAMYLPEGGKLVDGNMSARTYPQPGVTIPMETFRYNFTDAGRYLIEVNVTAASVWSFNTSFYVLPKEKLSAQKIAHPQKLYPGDSSTNLTITIRGEGILPNLTDKIEVILIIDRSGSMRGDRIAAAKQAAKSFAEYMLNQSNTRIGVMSFSSRSSVSTNVPLTSNLSKVIQGVDPIRAGGATAIGMGISMAREHFSQEGEPEAKRYMLLLSDGADTDSPSAHRPRDEALRAKNESVVIYTVGVGGGTDRRLMTDIANLTGGKFYYSPDPGTLEEIYQEIAGEIRGIAGRDVRIIDYVPRDIAINPDSLTPPAILSYVDNSSRIRWYIDRVAVGEELNFSFTATLQNITPGEKVVNRLVNITYMDAQGDMISLTLPEVRVRVAPSRLVLSLSTDKVSYSYGENVSIAVNVRNADEVSESAQLMVGIYDTRRSQVYDFSPIDLSLAGYESVDVNLNWNTSQVFSGSYIVVASANNLSVSTDFRIAPLLELTSNLHSAKQEYYAGEVVELHTTVSSLSPNYIFENLSVNLSVFGENSSVVYSQSSTVPVLLPSATLTLSYPWNTANMSPGNYTVLQEVYHNGTLMSTDNTTITIIPSFVARTGLEGTLEVIPVEIRGIDDVNFSYLAINTGNIVLDNVTLVVSLVSPSSGEMILNFSVNASLDIGENISGIFTAESLILPNDDYLVLLYGVYNSTTIPIDTAYLRVLATPRTLKNDSVNLLLSINTTEEHAQKEIARAVEHIEKSLGTTGEGHGKSGHRHGRNNEPLWLDDYHLNEKHGHKVFDEEKKAVKHLLLACSKDERHGMKKTRVHNRGNGGGNMHDDDGRDDKVFILFCSFNMTVIDVINNLLLADELLVNTSIKEAELAIANATGQKKVRQEIDKAYKELDRAYSAIDAKKYAKAIDYFKKAWRHAQHAIKHAEREENA